jgi:hypothetical protein
MQLGEPSGPFLAALVPGRVLDLERSLEPQVLDDGLNRPISAHSGGVLLEFDVSRGELSHGAPEQISKELRFFSPTFRALDRPGS